MAIPLRGIPAPARDPRVIPAAIRGPAPGPTRRGPVDLADIRPPVVPGAGHTGKSTFLHITLVVGKEKAQILPLTS